MVGVGTSGDGRVDELWRASGERLHAWFARRAGPTEADDLVQETFLRVHAGLASLQEGERLQAWLTSIARNVWIDHLRRRRGAAAEPAGEEPAEEPPPADNLDATVAGWLAGFLGSLAPEDAAALRFVDLEGRSQRELAETLGLSPSGAKSRVQRARARLRAALEACCALAYDGRGSILGARRRADGRCTGECD